MNSPTIELLESRVVPFTSESCPKPYRPCSYRDPSPFIGFGGLQLSAAVLGSDMRQGNHSPKLPEHPGTKGLADRLTGLSVCPEFDVSECGL